MNKEQIICSKRVLLPFIKEYAATRKVNINSIEDFGVKFPDTIFDDCCALAHFAGHCSVYNHIQDKKEKREIYKLMLIFLERASAYIVLQNGEKIYFIN